MVLEKNYSFKILNWWSVVCLGTLLLSLSQLQICSMSIVSFTKIMPATSYPTSSFLPSDPDSNTTLSKWKPKSYVWTYFIELDSDCGQCNYVKPDGESCQKILNCDATESTKGMRSNLSSQHGVKDSSKAITNQMYEWDLPPVSTLYYTSKTTFPPFWREKKNSVVLSRFNSLFTSTYFLSFFFWIPAEIFFHHVPRPLGFPTMDVPTEATRLPPDYRVGVPGNLDGPGARLHFTYCTVATHYTMDSWRLWLKSRELIFFWDLKRAEMSLRA